MKVKYTIEGRFIGKYRDTLFDESCNTVNDIITVIINHLKSIDEFRDGFTPKQQYKLLYVVDKGYDVTPQFYTNPEASFSASLRAFLNRSFCGTLTFTEGQVWKFTFWVFNSGSKLVILDSNARNLSKSMVFTIKVSLEA